MPEVHNCQVLKIEKLTEYAFALTITAPAPLCDCRPGQFIHIKCGHSRLLRRPVSICSAGSDTIVTVFEVRGDGTRWLSERRAGQPLSVLGPLGNGYDMPNGKVIVVGGGIGVPPMLFAASRVKSGVSAIIGSRDKSRLLLVDSFSEICDNVYITTDDGSLGTYGAVTKPLEQLLRGGEYAAVLACGPRVMLSAVAKLCEKYETACQVSMEERMGCGVGACLVCACRTVKDGTEHISRVCKDGPVFNAQEVLW